MLKVIMCALLTVSNANPKVAHKDDLLSTVRELSCQLSDLSKCQAGGQENDEPSLESSQVSKETWEFKMDDMFFYVKTDRVGATKRNALLLDKIVSQMPFTQHVIGKSPMNFYTSKTGEEFSISERREDLTQEDKDRFLNFLATKEGKLFQFKILFFGIGEILPPWNWNLKKDKDGRIVAIDLDTIEPPSMCPVVVGRGAVPTVGTHGDLIRLKDFMGSDDFTDLEQLAIKADNELYPSGHQLETVKKIQEEGWVLIKKRLGLLLESMRGKPLEEPISSIAYENCVAEANEFVFKNRDKT